MKKPNKYPIVMCKGNSHTPQRFWSYVIVKDSKKESELRNLKYVISNKKI